MIPTVVYTHSDYSDVMELFTISMRLLRYPKEWVTVFSDKPVEYFDKQIFYDDKKPYASRLLQCLGDYHQDKFIFLHEDFILYDEPDYSMIQKTLFPMMDLCKDIDFIRLLRSGESLPPNPLSDLLHKTTNHFAIQATIFRKSFLVNYLNKYPNHSIWDLEMEAPNNPSNGVYVHKTYADRPRGGHNDSTVFPYMATAVVKGKWNREYAEELQKLTYPGTRQFLMKRGWT